MYPNVESFAITDIGNMRKKNEDVFRILKDCNFFSIADGMGGHKAGDIAAKEASDHLCYLFSRTIHKKAQVDQIIRHIRLAIKEANFRVYNLSLSNQDLSGMGTTLCLLHINTSAIFAHIGDSRIYHLHKGNLIQLTKDHSLINKLKDQNRDFDEKIHKNIITKALGTHLIVEPSIDQAEFDNGDIFLLCTDGLSDYISDIQLKKILKSDSSLENLCENLIKEAKKNGSCDNITALAIKIVKK